MKKVLYLHLGIVKTGTTYLQHVLHTNAELLQSANYFYPTSPSYYYRHQLCTTDKGNFLQEYIDQIKKSNCANAILSSEVVLYEEPAHYKELMEHFDVKIVFFIRSLPSFIQSVQSKDLINSAYYSTYEHIYLYPLRQVSGHSILLFQNIQFWMDVFGEDNCIFLNYDACAKNKNIVPAFLEAIHCSARASDFIQNDIDGNVMLSVELLYFFGHTNFLPLNKQTRMDIVEQLRTLNAQGLFSTKYRLLSQESFANMIPKMLESSLYWWKDRAIVHNFGTKFFDAIYLSNKYVKDEHFFDNALEAYLALPEYPHLQLPADVQQHIFSLLSAPVQASIRAVANKSFSSTRVHMLPLIDYDEDRHFLFMKWKNACNTF